MKIWKISLSLLQKSEKVCFGENSKGVTGQSLHKETKGVTHASTQPCQQNPGTEMECTAETLPACTKGDRDGTK